jgi:hypothetical protein
MPEGKDDDNRETSNPPTHAEMQQTLEILGCVEHRPLDFKNIRI